MKTDKFLVTEIVDKFSRMFMLAFAGIILGLVFTFAYHFICSGSFAETMFAATAYCVLFSLYIAFTNAKRKVTKIGIFKDGLEFLFEQKNEITKKTTVEYTEIDEYVISPLSDKKNLALENPNPDKFSLRTFGFKTVVKLKDGSSITFQDGYSDGVLVYSPSYVYRMIDIARYVPNFTLVLENFDSKNDNEDFKLQFINYKEQGELLSFFKNKRYIKCLLRYSLFFIIAAVIGIGLATYFFMYKLGNVQDAYSIIYFILGILALIIVSLFACPLVSGFFGNIVNKRIQKFIKEIIEK